MATVRFIFTSDSEGSIEGVSFTIDGSTYTSDSNGEVTIDLAADTYSYTATKAGYQDQTANVTVEDYDMDYYIVMDEELYTITFTAQDTGGNPVEGVAIVVNDTEITTDSSGQATIDLYNNDWYYTYSKPDYKDGSGFVTVNGANVTETFTIEQKEQPKTITFEVKDDNDTVLEGATIDLEGNVKTTNSQGRTAYDLLNGTYDYSVSADGYKSFSSSVTVDGSNKLVNVTLEEKPPPPTPEEDTIIQIPLSNTLRVVLNNNAEIQNFDNRLLHEENYLYYNDITYLQKIKSTDNILIQFATNQEVTAEIYDYQDNLVVDKTDQIDNVFASTNFSIYNLNFSLGNSGIYYLKLSFNGVPFYSNYFQIDNFDESRLVKIEYNTSETDGILYNNNETFVIRLEGRLAEYQPGQNKESYTSFDETLINLKSYPVRKAVLEFGAIPRYMLEKLNLALAHENFYVNDVAFQSEEDIETEFVREGIDITNMYSGNVVLQQRNYETYTDATEDEAEETYYRKYNADGDLRVFNDQGDIRIHE